MATPTDAADLRFMNGALALARRGLGRVWPNPAVGCVLVDAKGDIVGRGWTQPGGRPHAETEALTRAGARASGATAYVTLEPCSHEGRTGPCADALIAAGIARAVIATEDRNPRVAGAGIEKLKRAGIALCIGVGRADAERLNAGFFRSVVQGLPLVTAKFATTLDGRIATHGGHSRWITGELARAWGHALRASHDALITAAGTVRADNPDMTCRLQGLEDRTPVRVVLDSRLTTPLTSAVVAGAARAPTWIVTREGAERERRRAFEDLGVEIIEVAADDGGRPEVRAALAALTGRGITRVLVEGGANVMASVLRAGVVDRIAWFRAAAIIGGDGLAALQGFGVKAPGTMPRFIRRRVVPCGPDVLELYDRSGPPVDGEG